MAENKKFIDTKESALEGINDNLSADEYSNKPIINDLTGFSKNYDKEYQTAHYNYKCKCGELGVIDVRRIKDGIECQHHLVCKICGKPASEDSHFYPKQSFQQDCLQNHNIQYGYYHQSLFLFLL